ncbi:flagellar biosynthetic protein FlhB [Mobilisporobacter senegalensis]|uniref:Flagellar biosynthetic protein FlhB n=1 Tax=Mobilisporobacter senegalensis TaxID=1329262 RepID=A0A3N1XZU3_9FIRM|nr:flagellar biosynthesis protein FlhB [Mobilisporobacter senegalensis]ROR30782.1 flagellar biosynthetic protein FlhB [Mobilisporobacter senegalensis]
MEKYLKYNLQFFAKEGPGGEKTEEATTKKLNDAREEGQVARSTELITATSLATLFIILRIFTGFIGTKFLESFRIIYYKIPDLAKTEFNVATARTLFFDILLQIIIISVPVFLSTIIVAILVNILQVKWKPTTKPLKPKFDKIDPLKGFKRIISMEKLLDLSKSVIKVGFMFYVVYDALKDEWATLINLYDIPLNQAIELIGSMTIDLGLKISMFFLIIGFADLFYQKMKFKKDMKMSKQEVKDEFKQSEGDPQIKSRIKSKMREASQRRMMQALPQADVVITNPTHLAVAIKYDKDSNSAPIVIAKGADYMALKIKEIARENQIEIVENKPLARMLYYNVDLDSEIPNELYQMVAEVLAYVYGLKNKMS